MSTLKQLPRATFPLPTWRGPRRCPPAICEQVQRGLRSKAYNSGRFSARENGVHHFQQLVREFLAE